MREEEYVPDRFRAAAKRRAGSGRYGQYVPVSIGGAMTPTNVPEYEAKPQPPGWTCGDSRTFMLSISAAPLDPRVTVRSVVSPASGCGISFLADVYPTIAAR